MYENIKSVTGYWNLDGSLNAQQKRYTNKDRTEIRIYEYREYRL